MTLDSLIDAYENLAKLYLMRGKNECARIYSAVVDDLKALKEKEDENRVER